MRFDHVPTTKTVNKIPALTRQFHFKAIIEVIIEMIKNLENLGTALFVF